MIELKDVLTLSDDNRYIVSAKAEYESYIYYLLVNEENLEDVKFVYQKDEETLAIVENEEILNILIPLFLEEARTSLTEEDIELVNELQQLAEDIINEE